MTPRGALFTLMIGVTLPFALTAGPSAAEVPKLSTRALPAQVLPIEIESTDVVETRSVAPDGTEVEAGHLGIALPCTPGVQPFIRQLDSKGKQKWLLTANASRDCNGDGQGDGGGEAMFEDWPYFSESYIMAGTTPASLFHPSGDSIYAGHILVAWMEGDDLVSAWGAFLMRVSDMGVRVGQAYFGVIPNGPPADVATCVALCDALSESSQDQYMSRSLALHKDTVVVGGSHRSAGNQEGGDKDVFLASLSDDLTTTHWVTTPRADGDDQVNAVASDDQGRIYAAGHYGQNQNAFAARFDPADGRVTHIFRIQGPRDDDADSVWVSQPNGVVQVNVSGSFFDHAYFGSQLVTGFGETDFTAHLTPELDLISVDLPGGSQAVVPSLTTGVQPAGTKSGSLDGGGGSGGGPLSESYAPENVVIYVGTSDNCDPTRPNEEENCIAQLLASDESFLKVTGELEDENTSLLDIGLEFHPDLPKLTEITIELESESCVEITLSLGGGNLAQGEFVELPETARLCALEYATVTFKVPKWAAQQLGFWKSLPQKPLLVRWKTTLHGKPCPAFKLCLGGAEELKVNHCTATSEFGDP